MKSSRSLFALVSLCFLATVAVLWFGGRRPASPAGPSGSNAPVRWEQSFDVRGRIVSLDAHSGIVKIAHEEIPDYMPAMTMPFLVRDSNSLRALKPGDSVRFKLAVTSDDSWISEIARSSETAPAQMPAASPETEDKRLKPGERVPALAFVDQNGELRSISDFAGKFVALTFIYTRCPLPNFCPLLNKKFSELRDRLDKEFPGRFHLVSVTIDPAHDTPPVLKAYARSHGADENAWTFATGSPEQIAAIAELFGLTYNQKNPGLIDHDMRTALIGPAGRVLHVWKSNFWTPYEIRNRIADELKSGGLAARN